jgi:signal transduction histidine kinase
MELKNFSVAEQQARHERNLKSKLYRWLRSYRESGRCDYEWRGDEVPWGTNAPVRGKYGSFQTEDGGAIGWIRLDGGRYIGFDVEPFEPDGRGRVWMFGAASAAMLALFLVLSAKGFALAAAAKRTREELETKNTFLDVVSHELNTPLASVLPLSSALYRDAIRDPQRRKLALETLSRESARMARMIEGLLTAVRLRNGKLEFSRERVELVEAAGGAVTAVCARDPQCRMRLDCAEQVSALADADKVVQILMVFLDNACKHADGKDVSVQCGRSGDGVVELRVLDRGPGLPPSETKRVFEKFHRLPSACGGLGLGLSVAAGLAAGMGGRVRAENREGGGCAFVLELPAWENAGGKEIADGGHTGC